MRAACSGPTMYLFTHCFSYVSLYKEVVFWLCRHTFHIVSNPSLFLPHYIFASVCTRHCCISKDPQIVLQVATGNISISIFFETSFVASVFMVGVLVSFLADGHFFGNSTCALRATQPRHHRHGVGGDYTRW